MDFATYNDLFHSVIRLYYDHEYDQALNILSQEKPRFPDHTAMITYLQASMATRAGQTEQAIQLLNEAFERGHWFGVELMRRSPALMPLHGIPEFEHLAELGMQRQIATISDPRMFILSPDNEEPYPLVFALHANGDNGLNTLYAWNQIIDQNWLLVAPQSAKAESSEGFVWNDQMASLRQLVQQFSEVQKEYQLDLSRIIVAGFSMGAETALHLALTSPLPIRGFILLAPLGPYFTSSEDWLDPIREAAGQQLRGYVVMGANDQAINQHHVQETVKMLNQHGVATQLEVVPNLGHDYPKDLLPIFERALAFIENSKQNIEHRT